MTSSAYPKASGVLGCPGQAGDVRSLACSRRWDGQGAELLHTVRVAFTASLHVTGVVAAVIFAGLAVLIVTMRPATRTSPAALPDYEATHSYDPAEAPP